LITSYYNKNQQL